MSYTNEGENYRKYGIFTTEAFKWLMIVEVPKVNNQDVTELVVNFKK